MKVSEEDLTAERTGPSNGWTRKSLAKWGVPWPPPGGWKKALLRGEPLPARKAKKKKNQGVLDL